MGSKVMSVQDGNLDEDVLRSSVPVVLDFSAEWCGPCRKMAPIMEEIASEFEGKAKVGTVDMGLSQEAALRFSILSVPTVLFIKDGKVRDQVVGLAHKTALVARLQRLL